MEKILTIQDISCYGQCSLTVALPVISAIGIETVIVPTTILSTHTGGFSDYTYLDLTSEAKKICDHLYKNNLEFDGIYTGYLGSVEQIELVENVIEKFRRKNMVVLIDPVMADNGSLYKGFNMDFVSRMKELCVKADVIVPNLTEACLLLDIPYKDYSVEEIFQIAKKLSLLGPKKVCITGVKDKNKLGVLFYDRESKEELTYFNDIIPKFYHGTGDLFASSFFGCLIKGIDFYESIKIATDFVVLSIKNTLNDSTHWYGVHFEAALPFLMKEVNNEN